MKKTTVFLLRFAILVGVGGLINVAQAQQTPTGRTGEVHVRVIERSGDTVTEIERTYPAGTMTDEKRDELVKNLVDSLKTARKGDSRQRQMTIIIDDNANVTGRPSMRNRRDFDWNDTNRQPGTGPGASNNRLFRYQFRADIDSVADRLNRLRFSFPNDLSTRLAQPFEAWSREFDGKTSTIRGLEAYPNNPDRNLLNVRFTAPGKGDVSVVVTNPKGKEVVRKEVKDFSGEFVGQMDLGINALGTYFITVTQNEDGAVKRIIVK